MDNTSSMAMGTSGSQATMDGGAEPLKQQAQQVVGETRQAAGQIVQEAREQVKTAINQQKEKAAGSIASVAGVLRNTSDQFTRQEEIAVVGRYAENAAEMVESFSNYLRERDIDELFGEVETFARRKPALFLGGAFVLGFALARFMKSSNEERSIVSTEQYSSYQSYQPSYQPTQEVDYNVGTPLPTAYERASASYTPAETTPMATGMGTGMGMGTTGMGTGGSVTSYSAAPIDDDAVISDTPGAVLDDEEIDSTTGAMRE